MNRIPNHHRRLEEAVKRAAQQGATNQNQPDELSYLVLIEGQPYLIGQRKNELIDGRTVSQIIAQASSGGTPFSHIKDVVLTSCGCKCNARTDQLFRCHYCLGIFCHRHINLWRKQGIAFCNSPVCSAKARVHQISHYGTRLLSFSLKNVFGFELDGQCTESGSQVRQIENEARVRASEREAEENEDRQR